MPTYYGTMIFAAGRYGWSEGFYLNENTHNEAHARMVNVANNRSFILGEGAVIEAVKVSDIAIAHDSITRPYSLKDLVSARDPVWTAALMTLRVGAGYRRSYLVRALEDAGVIYDADEDMMKIRPQILVKFQAYFNAIERNQLLMQVLDRSANNPTHAIISVTVSGDGYWQVECPGLIGEVGVGDNIVLYNFPRAIWGNLAGRRKIRSINGNIIEVFAQGPATIPFYPGQAEARNEVFIYPAIDSYSVDRVVKRDTGRRFFVTRGRR